MRICIFIISIFTGLRDRSDLAVSHLKPIPSDHCVNNRAYTCPQDFYTGRISVLVLSLRYYPILLRYMVLSEVFYMCYASSVILPVLPRPHCAGCEPRYPGSHPSHLLRRRLLAHTLTPPQVMLGHITVTVPLSFIMGLLISPSYCMP